MRMAAGKRINDAGPLRRCGWFHPCHGPGRVCDRDGGAGQGVGTGSG